MWLVTLDACQEQVLIGYALLLQGPLFIVFDLGVNKPHIEFKGWYVKVKSRSQDRELGKWRTYRTNSGTTYP